MKKILKIFLWVSIIFVAVFLSIFVYFSVGKVTEAKNITWGIDFSQMQAEALKLNWKEAYLAIINDLGVKNIKLHTQWNWIEGKKGEYYFGDTDWQLLQAKNNQVKIIYVLGIKTGRWPECHTPSWASALSKKEQQQKILDYIKEAVVRYKNNDAIAYWQVENEPFFKFGECPDWYYQDDSFLKSEVELVKSLDPLRQIIVSDSGEQSSWLRAGKIADIVGITMYREVWAHITDSWGFNFKSFLRPVTYWRKALLVQKIFGKKVMCIELQAEPWTSKPFYGVSLEEQARTMNLDLFKKNVAYARQTGLDTFYFWGVEWWYWMKSEQNRPDIWNEAKILFK